MLRLGAGADATASTSAGRTRVPLAVETEGAGTAATAETTAAGAVAPVWAVAAGTEALVCAVAVVAFEPVEREAAGWAAVAAVVDGAGVASVPPAPAGRRKAFHMTQVAVPEDVSPEYEVVPVPTVAAVSDRCEMRLVDVPFRRSWSTRSVRPGPGVQEPGDGIVREVPKNTPQAPESVFVIAGPECEVVEVPPDSPCPSSAMRGLEVSTPR